MSSEEQDYGAEPNGNPEEATIRLGAHVDGLPSMFEHYLAGADVGGTTASRPALAIDELIDLQGAIDGIGLGHRG